MTREVPDRLVGVGELIGEEAAAVELGEDAGVAPALAGQRPGILLRDGSDVEDVHDEQVARLGALDGDRAGEHVHRRQRCVEDVVGRIVVDDGTVEPFATVHPERVALLDRHRGRDVRVPPVVAQLLLIGELLGRVEREYDVRH